jgi:tetratricopeptide (TPR) repeat protein
MICSGKISFIITVGVCLALLDNGSLHHFAVGATNQNVGRKTQDRDEDLIQALLDRGRFDDALALCRLRLTDLDLQSDAAAKWRVRESKALTAQQMGRDTFGDQELVETQRPISDLLRSYPDHRRVLFLKSQLLNSEKSAALHSVLRAVVSPRNDEAQELATRRLLTAMKWFTRLADEVQEKRSALESARNATSRGMIADLSRLGQQLQIDAVSLALMQTDLFPRGSADCIAAATKAEQVADEAITRLPVGTIARKEVERLRVEAVFRAAQFERCDALLNELTPQFNDALPPKLQALKVRLCIAQGQMGQAGKLLTDFFGDVPEASPNALEMDLARLEFLLVTNAGRRVGDWLDAIQRRGGDYARRRADAVSLSHLKSTGQSPAMVDPSLVAAQGQKWLRQNDPSRAGDLLAAAAAAESDPDRAMTRVAEAAAALLAAKRIDDAIELLQDVSLAKPDAEKSPATHLQAAILITKLDLADPATVKRLEEVLRVNLKRWPESSNSASIRSWLGKILTSQERYPEAAAVLSQVKPDRIDHELAQVITDAWLLVLQRSAADSAGQPAENEARDSEKQNWPEVTKGFKASMSKLIGNQTMRTHYRLLSALYLDRSALGDLKPSGSGRLPEDVFIDSLIAFRQKGQSPTESPPADLLAQVERRLMADARVDPALRGKTVAVLAKWMGEAPVSMDSAERCLWKGDAEKAIELLRGVRKKSKDSLQLLQKAAEMLGSTDNKKAQQAGVMLWDELASGFQQGSNAWHEAKLSAIGLLQRMGDRQEAYRRAKFVLLTQVSMSDDVRHRYQSVEKP